MYDELVKQLKEDKSWVEQGTTQTEHEIAEHIQQAADAIEELTGFVQEAERDRDEYRERLDKAADAIKELSHDYEKLAEDFNGAVELLHKREKPRWIPVTERLPEDLQNVLVIDEGRVTIGHCEHYYGEEDVYVEWHDTLYYPIDTTHWMPLPEPPKEE